MLYGLYKIQFKVSKSSGLCLFQCLLIISFWQIWFSLRLTCDTVSLLFSSTVWGLLGLGLF